MKSLHTLFILCTLCAMLFSCNHGGAGMNNEHEKLLLERVGYPQGIFCQGKYYFTFQSLGGDSVELLCTDQLEKLS